MFTRFSGWGIAVFLVVALLNGCQSTAPEVAISKEVVPHTNEYLVLDDIVLVVDASGSMYFDEKFNSAKALNRSFISGMPDAGYLAGLISFGGDFQFDWITHAPECFDRENLLETANSLKWLRGTTPLNVAIQPLDSAYEQLVGRSAIVVFSDGKSDAQDVLKTCQELIASHKGNLCIHTVQIGDDEYGRNLLQSMAELSCGSFRTAADITTLDGMDAFIREVFYGVGSPNLDTDGDGVMDSKDRCPNTPEGAPVDEWGCWTIGEALFTTDKWSLRPAAKPVLDEAAAFLKAHPELKLYVDGHTDSRADDEYNLNLSIKRSHTIFMALVNRGIDFHRLVPRAFGEKHPRVPNNTADNLQLNRRVELRVKQ